MADQQTETRLQALEATVKELQSKIALDISSLKSDINELQKQVRALDRR